MTASDIAIRCVRMLSAEYSGDFELKSLRNDSNFWLAISFAILLVAVLRLTLNTASNALIFNSDFLSHFVVKLG